MITFKYKNSLDKFISSQQASILTEYKKVFLEGGIILKEEEYYEDELLGVYLYNNTNVAHENLINNNQSLGYKWFVIVEIIPYNNLFLLKKLYHYDIVGSFIGTTLELYDPNGELIAFGLKDASGNYDYSRTQKYYYDRNINSDYHLFVCTYESNGDLWGLDWNSEHTNFTGQDSFVFENTLEHVQEVMQLTGLSQDMVEYFMSSEIEPNF